MWRNTDVSRYGVLRDQFTQHVVIIQFYHSAAPTLTLQIKNTSRIN
ncbi:hypothetical protein ECMA6_2935 [Escherichia coli MA6]|nr:hypothetical protein ECMA6_2935 [Escherichia coli MA6]